LVSIPRSVFVLLLALLALACATGAKNEEISRERAIEIARQHLTFEAKSVEAEQAAEQGRPVWRVTFRGREANPPDSMGEFLTVDIDRKTGELVSIAMA
jgi:uncharacterized membrane protein YkoI